MLVNHDFHDTVNYTLVNQKYIDDGILSAGEAIEMISPLSDARRYIRTSLMNSLLETLSYNLDHYNSNVNIFEISKVYAKDIEQERLGIVMQGNIIEEKIEHVELKADFYVMKGIVMEIINALGFELGRIQLKENDIDTIHFHPYQSAVLSMNNKPICIFGKLHPNYLKSWKLSDIYYAEMLLDDLAEANPGKVKAPVISKYPSVSRDISLMLKDDIKAGDLLAAIKKAGGKLVKSSEVFDVYQGEHIEEGYKSVSINIVYEDKEKTLKAEDVNEVHDRVVKELSDKFNATQR